MNRQAQSQQLAQFLANLQPRHVRKLALALEHQRVSGKGKFPFDEVLDILRPSLASMRMPRVMTPQRILCAPFEDLLRPDDPEVKQIGLISRASIAVMWAELQELEPTRLQELCDAFGKAQKTGNHGAAGTISRNLWQLAADALSEPLRKAASDSDAYKSYTERLGGSRRAEDLREIQAVLAIAEQVEHIKTLLPRKPIRRLSDDDITMISRIYEELAAEKQGREVFLLMVVLNRLEQKFELMKIIRNFSPKMDDTLAVSTELRTAGDLVIDALEMDADGIYNAAANDQNEDGLMRLARRYATNFNGITSEIGIRRDGAWGQRMFASRAKVSEAIDQCLLAAAPSKILSVLPHSEGPNGISIEAPDFRTGIDYRTYLVAERRARAVAESARMSEQLGVANSAGQTVEIVKRGLNRYGSLLLKALPRTMPAQLTNARNHLFTTVLLLELMTKTNEADLLRRRGLEAMSSIKPPPDPEDSLQAALASGEAMEILRPDSVA